MSEKLSPEYRETEKYQYPFDAVVVLGGGLVKVRDKFYPTDYRQGDEFGMLGAGMRMVAAIDLYLNKQAKTFIFSTGRSEKTKTVYGQDVPTEAETYEDKFLRSLQALKKRSKYQEKFKDLEEPEFILEDRSSTTLTNVREILQIVKEKRWQKIAFVSNSYHIPRIKALWAKVLEEHPEIKTELEFLPAEEVAKKYEPGKYDKVIGRFYQTPEAKKRINNEQKGLQHIESGEYAPGEFQLEKKEK